MLVGLVLAAGVVVVRFSLIPVERARSPSPGSTSGRLVWIAPVLVAVLVMIALTVPVVAARRGEAGSWAVAAAVACLGLVLVATARGHALRLLVQVKKGADDDPAGTAYVLARLQELGSSPPEGLRTPQQLDVEDLPTAALKSLPAGRVATVLLPLINLVLPGTPWRAVIEGGDASSRVVVTVTRNGSVVRTALVDAGRFLPASSNGPTSSSSESVDEGGGGVKKTPDSETADRGDLLTAAAAVVLTELSKVHVELTKGLCGASRWESVAAYVVATKPPATAGGSELRRELLAYAVQEDPLNSLAQLAYANLQGEHASGPTQVREYAERLERVLRDIEQQGRFEGAPGSVVWGELSTQLLAAARRALHAERGAKSQANSAVAELANRLVAARNAAEKTAASAGYLPLCLRAEHALIAAWLNAAVEERDATQAAAVAKAAVHFRSLVQLLEMPRDTGGGSRDVFREEMSRVAWALKRTFTTLAQIGYPEPQLPDPPVAPGGRALTSLHVEYDDACRLAKAGEVDAAVKALERAAGLERNRRGALVDPWFADLRTARSPDVHAVLRFWEIVGPPAEAFTDLPPFWHQGVSR